MLTEKAAYQRKWGNYPGLASFLNQKHPKVRWTGPTSVSRNIFEGTIRLLEIYALVQDHMSEIKSHLQPDEARSIHEELRRLSEELKEVSRFFSDASEEAMQLSCRVTD